MKVNTTYGPFSPPFRPCHVVYVAPPPRRCYSCGIIMAELQETRARLFAALRREMSQCGAIQAMEQVPRELFVPPESRHLAYEDIPLPIGYGQTISQPYIVAMMTEALELTAQSRVLEIGTGSGYQAAVLAQLAARVVTVERVASLAEATRTRLEGMGYTNAEVRLAGAVLGCPEEGPFDAIVVTAGAPHLSHLLLDQMAAGGRMVIPIGSESEQDLVKVVRNQEGYSVRNLGACRFVPLIGPGAWDA